VDTRQVGDALALAYRDLIGAEARLGETLAKRGVRIGSTLADQWPTLHEYLGLYARGLSPAGMLVLGGRPDDGSRATGIPFTGAEEARHNLGLSVPGAVRSPSGAAFWRAVEAARAGAQEAPIDSLFGTVHLAHAQPFDFAPEPEVREASAAHVLRMLDIARPQAVVCVGADALGTLARALRNQDLADLAAAPESAWLERWPPGTRLSAYPRAEAPLAQPFRLRVVPVPALSGPLARAGEQALASAFSYVLA
jgi:uracil-DNA glycosylase